MIFSKKGMTLIEILVAVTIFSIMMIFITQMIRSSMRYKKKISGDVRFQREISNVLDLFSEDFSGVTEFFDFNKNLQRLYPLNLDNVSSSGNFLEERQDPGLFFNLSFNFVGKDQSIEMATFSWVEPFEEKGMHQMIKINYFLEDCEDLKTNQISKCLIRSVVNFQNEAEIFNKYVILRDIQSLSFFYYDERQETMLKNWNYNSVSLSSSKWLPDQIQINIQWKSYQESYSFPVSYPLVRNQKNQLARTLDFVNRESKKNNEIKNKNNKLKNQEPTDTVVPPPPLPKKLKGLNSIKDLDSLNNSSKKRGGSYHDY